MTFRYFVMKRIIAAFFLICCYVQCHTQTDTTHSKKKFNVFSVKAEFGVPPWLSPSYASQESYRKLTPGNELLSADYSSYKNSQAAWLMNNNINLMPGIKLYMDLGGKKHKRELYIGLTYSRELISGLYLYRESQDTIGTYVNLSTNKVLYDVLTTSDSYQFGIQANRWMIPIGFNFTTSREKFFWVSAGLELAPAISTNYRLVTWHSMSQNERLLEPGAQNNYNSGYTNYADAKYSQSSRSTAIKGTGFGLYVSTPLCVYIHPFKRVRFLKHFNPTASVTPYFGFAKHKYNSVNSGFGLMGSLGIRYNW